MKHTVCCLYVVVVAVMAAATIVEQRQGTSWVATHIYGAWWFTALWALLAASGLCYFLSRRVRQASTVALHLSLLIILAGALLTHLTAWQGVMHLRAGQTDDRCVTDDGRLLPLPFAVTLDSFLVEYHAGTDAPIDYRSHLTVAHNGRRQTAVVSMNHIFVHSGVRLYQTSYDQDGQGSVLSVGCDPWGIPVTYTGYALLFVSLLWILVDPHGTYRQLLRQMSRMAAILMLVIAPLAAGAQTGKEQMRAEETGMTLTGIPDGLLPTLPREVSEQFGRVLMVYHDRVCPVETYAIDFTKQVCGHRSYQGLSATQVLAGFIFFYDQWVESPITQTRVKRPGERSLLLAELHSGQPLRLFPYDTGQRIVWYAPTSRLPAGTDPEHARYIRQLFAIINGAAQAADWAAVEGNLRRLQTYQRTFGGASVPNDLQLRAEYLYNSVPFATILFMVCLCMGLVSFLLLVIAPASSTPTRRLVAAVQRAVMLLCLVALTFCLALRWVITANIPLSNGYETMLVLAWMVLLVTLPLSRRAAVMTTFGFLLAGFCLLVSHLSQMDPQMTPLMPVLQSPLLTLHVSIIMMAYALLSLTALCGIAWLCAEGHKRFTTGAREKEATAAPQPRSLQSSLTLLSRLLLYPAMTCLGMGIFIGAIWANVSWGTYWSWDPKETWALITLMTYAVALHHRSLPWLRRPAAYHAFVVAAFLTLLMTYFGVNYLLGGMHSYA